MSYLNRLENEKQRRLTKANSSVIVTILATFYLYSAFGLDPLIGLSIAIYLFYRNRNGPALVVWLRRFGHEKSSVNHFRKGLKNVMKGLGRVITLKDSIIRKDSAPLLFGVNLFYRVLLSLFLLSMSVGWVVGLIEKNLIDRVLAGEFFLAVQTCIVLLIIISIVFFLLTKPHPSIIDISNIHCKNEKVIMGSVRKIRKQRAAKPIITIFRCPDINWEASVFLLIKHADVVIFDTYELTDALTKELTYALDVLSSERIILASDTDFIKQNLLTALDRGLSEKLNSSSYIRYNSNTPITKLQEIQKNVIFSALSRSRTNNQT